MNRRLMGLALATLTAACTGDGRAGGGAGGGDTAPWREGTPSASAPAVDPTCLPGDDGLTLADGFCLALVHDGVGRARHLTATPGGDLYVALGEPSGGGSIVALRDTTGDGRADVEVRFGETAGSGILYHDGWLYFSPNDRVLRYPMEVGELEPTGEPETLVTGLPTGGHGAKSLAVLDDGRLLVNIGSRSNACQETIRTEGSPGQDPCPELSERAGVWTFDPQRQGQTGADGDRYATGLRNAYALAVHPATGQVYSAVHGRDQLHELWSEHFTQEQSAEKPAEQFVAIDEGDDFGWPYCYFDPQTDTKVLAPEYGGDGGEVGRCDRFEDPEVDLPAHWAPNDLTFYTADRYPGLYRNGGFIAFHGSWNRAPLPQGGYNVVFVAFEDGRPTGDWSVFAEGFPMGDVSPQGARWRPTGVAVAPDGRLLLVDGQVGRIWRVVYEGG